MSSNAIAICVVAFCALIAVGLCASAWTSVNKPRECGQHEAAK